MSVKKQTMSGGIQATKLILLEGDRLYEAFMYNTAEKDSVTTALVRGYRSMFHLKYDDVTEYLPAMKECFGSDGNTFFGVTTSNEANIKVAREAFARMR